MTELDLRAEMRRVQKKHDDMVAVLRAQSEEIESLKAKEKKFFEHFMDDNFFERPAVKKILGNIKDEVEAAWRDSLDEAVGHIRSIVEARKDVLAALARYHSHMFPPDAEVLALKEAERVFADAVVVANDFAKEYKVKKDEG